MYIKVVNGAAVEYDLARLRQDNPRTSFPFPPSADLLASYGVFPVEDSALPTYNPLTQNVVTDGVEYAAGAWRKKYRVENLAVPQAAQKIRTRRADLLAQTDWVVLRALETGGSVPAPIAAYRQALRDLPQQPGFPFSIDWPAAPETL